MKKFIELIERVHKERFSVVMGKIIAEKIPVAFLSLAPIEQASRNVASLIANSNINIKTLITNQPNTPPRVGFKVNGRDIVFDIVHLNNVAKLQPRPEYIFVTGENLSNWDHTSARIALKHFPNAKVLDINGNTETVYYRAFMEHLTALNDVYESLIDEESKKTFCGYWLAKILHSFGEIVYANTSHYITAGFIPKNGDVFIDVGAYDGYTALKFLNLGCEVYAFEMDRLNFELTQKFAEEKKFTVENFGLGSYKHEMKYTHSQNPGGSHLNYNGSDVTQIITLDSYVGEHKLPHVDFIKIDTEGAELDVLKGAALTIARFKPILAVSAYHKPDDFWILMNFIKSIRPDYKFALRQYAEGADDYSLFFEGTTNQEILNSMGLEPDFRNYKYECVLFAR